MRTFHLLIVAGAFIAGCGRMGLTPRPDLASDAPAAGGWAASLPVTGSGGTLGAIGSGGSVAIAGRGGSTPASCAPPCSPDTDCVDDVCVERLGGTTCQTSADCQDWATCCSGSDESCDGTRLPPGDGTQAGQFVILADRSSVMDRVTALTWQRDVSGPRVGPGCDGTTCTWEGAASYCAGLRMGGFTDWRLPARKELNTIVDFTRPHSSIDPEAFPDTPIDWFWTSTPLAYTSLPAWRVFIDGTAESGDSTMKHSVRCVRGSRCYPKSRFVVLPDGLVKDTLTRLVWQQDGSGERKGSGCDGKRCSWAGASAYCAGLVMGSAPTFRLPTVKELESLVDLKVAWPGPTIDRIAFPGGPANELWTASPGADPDSSSRARFVDFTDGFSGSSDRRNSLSVRCVR